jgi:hypothetical protein
VSTKFVDSVDKICWQCRQNLLAVSTKFVGSVDKICWQCRQNLLAVSTKFVDSVDKICWQCRQNLLAVSTKFVGSVDNEDSELVSIDAAADDILPERFIGPIVEPVAFPAISSPTSFSPFEDSYEEPFVTLDPIPNQGKFTTHQRAKGPRVTVDQLKYLNLLHLFNGHYAPSTILDAFSTWHGLPSWLTKPLFESYLRSHHCLLCETFRRRRDHPLGSGMPNQIPGYELAYDPVWFSCATVFGAIGFYLFYCRASGAIRLLLARDKTQETLLLIVYRVETWLKRYGHTLVKLRSDAGSTENSDALQTALGHISVDNMSSAAPENQQANPAERQIQAVMQQVKLNLAGTRNIGAAEWGLSVLKTERDYGGTMGAKAKFLSDGTMSRNQIITGEPYRVPRYPIEFGAIVTAYTVGGSKSSPNNEVFRYLMPANFGTQADIVVSLSNRKPFKMFIRKGVRPLHLLSQLNLSRSYQDVKFSKNSDGEVEISGMLEPPSVYADEGFDDPMDVVGRPTLSIPSLSTTVSDYRDDSAVPDSLQMYISAAEEALVMRPGVVTRSMDRPSTPEFPASVSSIAPSDSTEPVRDAVSPVPTYWHSEPTDYTTEDEVDNFVALSIYEKALHQNASSSTTGLDAPRTPVSYDSLVSDLVDSREETHRLECLARATAHSYETNYSEHLLFSSKGYTEIINPFPSGESIRVRPFSVAAPAWHDSAEPILFDSSNMIRNASEELANLSYGKHVMSSPELSARWDPVVALEMKTYLGVCIHEATPAWFAEHPDVTVCDWICVLGEKRDATTGLHLKDKARFALDGSVEIRAGLHPDPSKYYCNTLGAMGLHYQISHAAWKSWKVSTSDSKQAFQHTPSTRSKPDVLWLPKQMTGAATDGWYYLTTLFQGLPEASRGWFNFTCGRDGFLQRPPCNMTANTANPCLLYWRGPPTFDPGQQGEVMLGISTDDNLETHPDNAASRAHLEVIRQAYADHGIETVVKDYPDQLLGQAITYSILPESTSIKLTSPLQILDLKNLFYPNDAPVPTKWTPLPPSWSEESRDNSPTIHIDLHRSPVGIFIHLGNTRFDSACSISRHCSRTRQHTQMDYEDMRHHAAYLWTTRELGITYHSRRPGDPEQYLLTGTSDYAHSVYADGLGQIGTAVIGGCGFRGISAPITVSSVKDSGLPAISTPDGELKADISVTKTVLDMKVLATDSGNPQPAVGVEIDSQTVDLVTQDFSGKTQVYRHRRRDLAFVVACNVDKLTRSVLVPAEEMVADGLTKVYGPLTHWRRIAWLLGESPELAALRSIVFAKYSKNKPSAELDQDLPVELDPDVDPDGGQSILAVSSVPSSEGTFTPTFYPSFASWSAARYQVSSASLSASASPNAASVRPPTSSVISSSFSKENYPRKQGSGSKARQKQKWLKKKTF